MAETLLILGDSGSGKSTSLRNLNPEETFIISTTGKPLPWRGYKKQYTKFKSSDQGISGNFIQTCKADKIIKLLKLIDKRMPHIKQVCIDDLQYVMSFEFMDRSSETGYSKFTEIGKNFTDILRLTDQLRDDLKVIFLSHSENTGDAINEHYSLKTIGKLVNEKITPEGLFTYVFYTIVEEGDSGKMEYKLLTNTDGKRVAKTPLGMFEDLLIDNDLNEIIKVIDEYNNG